MDKRGGLIGGLQAVEIKMMGDTVGRVSVEKCE
jgi:hypothetical protein